MATATTPITNNSGFNLNSLLDLIGRNTNIDTSSQQFQQALTQALQTGSQSGGSTANTTTTNTADLGPLQQAFAQASAGMSPDQLSALITSVFQEGAKKVPELTGQYANATGSRVSGNSGLQLALGDLNRDLSTQAVNQLLQYNSNAQQTAANTAAQIAANTRQTQQQQAATQQQQTQQSSNTNQGTATQSNQQQQQQTSANPLNAALLAGGGTLLNFLDKKGAFNGLFGRATGAAGNGVGTISGSNTSLAPTGGGTAAAATPVSSGTLSSAAPVTSGFIETPSLAAPTAGGGGFSMPAGGGGGITSAAGGAAPALDFSGLGGSGITGLGGYGANSSGLLGTAADFGWGALPSTANYFDTLSSGSLGSNLSFGSNPFGYGGSAGGITGAVGMEPAGFGDWLSGLGSNIGSAASGFGDSLLGFGSGLWDTVSSFFADGGRIPGRFINRGVTGPLIYADGGMVANPIAPNVLTPYRFGGARFADGGTVHPDPTRRQSSNYTTDQIRAEELARRMYDYNSSEQNLARLREENERTVRALSYNAGAGRGRGYADGGMVNCYVPNPIADKTVSPARFGGAGRFADGGGIGYPGDGRYGAGGSPVAPTPGFPTNFTTNLFEATRRQREMAAGLRPQEVLQPGTVNRIPAGTPTGTPVTMGGVAELLPFLLRSALGFADGGIPSGLGYEVNPVGSYADGGQVQTGVTPTRVRNQNFMGARPQEQDPTRAINYEGYAPAVGASTPAGAVSSPALPAVVAPMSASMAAAPAATGGGTAATNYSPEQIQQFYDHLAQVQMAEAAARAQAEAGIGSRGGSGGVGEGAAPTGSDTEGTPGGIGAAPPGTPAAISAALGLVGLGVPGLSAFLSAIAALSQQVQAATLSQQQAASQASGNANASDGADADAGAVGSVDASVSVDASTTADGSDADAGSGATGPGGSSGVGDSSSWADGGMVRGPGTGTSDSIRVKSKEPGGSDIRYSDGEMIIPVDTVQRYGQQFFQNLIDMTHTPVNR